MREPVFFLVNFPVDWAVCTTMARRTKKHLIEQLHRQWNPAPADRSALARLTSDQLQRELDEEVDCSVHNVRFMADELEYRDLAADWAGGVVRDSYGNVVKIVASKASWYFKLGRERRLMVEATAAEAVSAALCAAASLRTRCDGSCERECNDCADDRRRSPMGGVR